VECDELPTQRQRDICDGTAGIPLTGPHGRNAYLKSWGMPTIEVATASKPFKIDRPKQATPKHLVGTELTKLIAEYGIKPVKSCGCDSWKQKLNEWGVEGCVSNRQAIIAHLGEAYHAATWWQTLTAAGNAAFKSLPLTLGGMVDEAIRRSETSPGN
jgi:hypothetical protein